MLTQCLKTSISYVLGHVHLMFAVMFFQCLKTCSPMFKDIFNVYTIISMCKETYRLCFKQIDIKLKVKMQKVKELKRKAWENCPEKIEKFQKGKRTKKGKKDTTKKTWKNVTNSKRISWETHQCACLCLTLTHLSTNFVLVFFEKGKKWEGWCYP